MDKKTQLRLFVNSIGLGQGARGFDQAARHYCNKPFKALSRDEYISLVAMIVAPATFNLKTHHKRNAERVARIKLLMAGKYKPKGLCDIYYGKLSPEIQKGLAPYRIPPAITVSVQGPGPVPSGRGPRVSPPADLRR